MGYGGPVRTPLQGAGAKALAVFLREEDRLSCRREDQDGSRVNVLCQVLEFIPVGEPE